jgi:predicted DNA-binding mobile mystery protein A
MNKSRISAQARSAFDIRFDKMRPIAQFAAPARGWIKAIRQALGMSSSQLARRLGVRQPTVIDIEQSEMRDTIQLATLRRVAEALDCKLVYALVPNKPLEATVRKRARQIARRRLRAVEHTMLLENGNVSTKDIKARLDELARDVSGRALWDEI